MYWNFVLICSKCLWDLQLCPQVERVIMLCPYFREFTSGGSMHCISVK